MDLRKTALAKLTMALNLFQTTVPISIPPEMISGGIKLKYLRQKD